MVLHAVKEARAQRFNLAVMWLDIANTYGSIPHKLIVFLLYIDMVSLLSGSDSLKHIAKGFSINNFLNQQLVLGIDINGEFLLAALFLLLAGMNIILEYSLQAGVPQFTTNNTALPVLRAFMGDLSLMSSTVSGSQTLLSWCKTALT